MTFEDNSSLKKIGAGAFQNNNITSIVIPNSVTSIENGAFFGGDNKIGALTDVTFEDNSSLKTIGAGAFYNNSITSIVIPSSVTSIGNGAFLIKPNRIDALTDVIFEDNSSLKKIGAGAFYNNSITSIVIPSSVTSIGNGAFEECSLLKTLTMPETPPETIADDAFLNTPSIKNIFITDDSGTIITTNQKHKEAYNAIEANLGANDLRFGIETDTLIYNFGSVQYGADTEAKTITLKNTFTIDVNFAQPESTNFIVSDFSKTKLAEGESATFTITPKASLGVGTYNEVINVKAENGVVAQIDVSVTIVKKPLESTMIASISDQPYTGNQIKPTISVIDGLPSIIEEIDYTVSYSNNKNVGTNTATATITAAADGNYSGAVTKKFSITKEDSTITTPFISKEDITYGESFDITFTPKVLKKQTMLSRLISEAPATNIAQLYYENTLLATQNNVGENTQVTFAVNTADKSIPATAFDGTEQTFTIKWGGDDNLNTSTGTIKAILNKKVINATANVDTTKEYDGNNNFIDVSLTITNIVGKDTLTAQANGKSVNANVGKSEFTATSGTLYGEDKYYYILENSGVSGDVSITKAPLQIIGGNVTAKTYDGNTQAIVNDLTFSGVVNGESLVIENDYKLESAYFDDKNAGINKNVTGEVKLEMSDISKNYTLSSDNYKIENCEIKQKQINSNMVGNISSKTYTGQEIKPSFTVTDGEPSIIKISDYTVMYENNTNAGQATAIITAKGNYSGSKSATFEITKANATDAMKYVSGKVTMGGEEQATIKLPTVDGITYEIPTTSGDITISNMSIKDNILTYSASSSDAGDKGIIQINVTSTDNYEPYTINVTITSTEKLIQEIIFENVVETKTYGDNNFTKTVTKVEVDGDITYASDDASVATVDSITGEVKIIGHGEVNITATASETRTHAKSEISYSLNVAKANLTFTADDKNIVATGTLPEFTYKVDGLAFDDLVTTIPNITTVADGKTKGIFDIVITDAIVDNIENYNITYVNSLLTITLDTIKIRDQIIEANSVKSGIGINESAVGSVNLGIKYVNKTQMDALNEAILVAENMQSSSSTIDEVEKAVKKLNEAITLFKNAIKVGKYVAPPVIDNIPLPSIKPTSKPTVKPKVTSTPVVRPGNSESNVVGEITVDDIEMILEEKLLAKDVLTDDKKGLVADDSNIAFVDEHITLSKEVIEITMKKQENISFIFEDYAVTIDPRKIVEPNELILNMEITNNQEQIVIIPSNKGDFGLQLEVRIKALADMESIVNLYYETSDNIIVDYGELNVDEYGYITVNLVHASKYFITDKIVENAITKGEYEKINATIKPVISAPPYEEIVGTGDSSMMTLLIIIIILFGATGVIFVIIKKRKEDKY